MAKLRVHELAKELGVDSKTVLAKLSELGEFVKSASSTVEAPVVRRLREAFPATPAAGPAAGPAQREFSLDGWKTGLYHVYGTEEMADERAGGFCVRATQMRVMV